MEKKERIVHLTTVHHPYDPRIYHKQCASLAKAGYDTVLIAQEAETEAGVNPQVTHIPLKTYGSRIKRMIFGQIAAYKKAKAQEASIYVFHDPELMLVGALLKNKYNTVIYDIHEDYVTSILQKKYLPLFVRKIIAKVYKGLESVLLRKMEISLAEKYYYDLYKRGKWILNYPLMDEQMATYERPQTPAENKVLYTGNVTVVRGALMQANLPNMVPDIEVDFIGKCPRVLAEEMYAIAGDKKDQIHITGIDAFVEKADIEAKYIERNWLAGIAIFPPTEHYLKKELTKFFEYMNVGLPIICSNFPTWQAFIDLYQCGIAVDPYNEAEIKAAIETLQNNPDLARQMGENGQKAVRQHLNWQAEEAKLLQWYDELIKG